MPSPTDIEETFVFSHRDTACRVHTDIKHYYHRLFILNPYYNQTNSYHSFRWFSKKDMKYIVFVSISKYPRFLQVSALILLILSSETP